MRRDDNVARANCPEVADWKVTPSAENITRWSRSRPKNSTAAQEFGLADLSGTVDNRGRPFTCSGNTWSQAQQSRTSRSSMASVRSVLLDRYRPFASDPRITKAFPLWNSSPSYCPGPSRRCTGRYCLETSRHSAILFV